ncbi:electron transport complex protein RnfG [Alteromonadaceae bacterium Bs31]|nr:electron transport complex protein RnfG [Alteromonadaceae bacterium Bs31]
MSTLTFNKLVLSKLELWRCRVDYQGAILGLICALVTLLLLIGQQKTFEPIQQRLAEDRLAVLSQVLPSDYYDNNPLEEVHTLVDENFSAEPIVVYLAKKQETIKAVVFQIDTEGYGGTMTLMIALNTHAEILGLRVLSHKETPGLADKIETDKSAWITVFNGESLKKTSAKDWAVKKDGGKFDQFTGATITPRAVIKGVVAGLEFYARNADQLTTDTPLTSEEPGDG